MYCIQLYNIHTNSVYSAGSGNIGYAVGSCHGECVTIVKTQ